MNPDPTPPSPPDHIPPWGRQLLKQVQEQRRDHEALKAKQGADTMSFIHLLDGVAKAADSMSTSSSDMKKQLWGAIKELRKQLKENK